MSHDPLSARPQSARDDLAFLRGLIDTGESIFPGFGEAYLAAGVVYGVQMLLHAAQFAGLAPASGQAALAIGLGPTLMFLPVLFWINWRHRHDRPPAAVGRAIGSIFGAVGLANLVLVAVIGSVAWREHSIVTWLIYPCAVFVLQGAAWLVSSLLRRRPWMAAVAGGWFASAIAMASSIQAMSFYILFAGLGIWLCMALPGWVLMRLSRRPVQMAALAA